MTTVLFFASMFGLFTLLSYKAFEIKVRKIRFVADLFNQADLKMHAFMDVCVGQYKHVEKVLRIFLTEFLPSYLYELSHKSKDYISKKYYNAGNEFRGKRMLRSSGSVSFFLERLAEEKAEANTGEF